jgi:CBS domain-containing protein
MAKRVQEIMTEGPACCTPETTLDKVAKMMVQNDCGEIPVVDASDCVIGVITDRDIVCRVVAEGGNPAMYTAADCMSQPVITVSQNAPIEDVVSIMEKHMIRRVPVTSDGGRCAGIVSQADLARTGPAGKVAELVREVSQGVVRPSH